MAAKDGRGENLHYSYATFRFYLYMGYISSIKEFGCILQVCRG